MGRAGLEIKQGIGLMEPLKFITKVCTSLEAQNVFASNRKLELSNAVKGALDQMYEQNWNQISHELFASYVSSNLRILEDEIKKKLNYIYADNEIGVITTMIRTVCDEVISANAQRS